MSCSITLRGTLETSLVVIESRFPQVGAISGMSWSGCTGGEIQGILSLPWPILLESLDHNESRLEIARSLREAIFRVSNIALALSRIGTGTNCLFISAALFFELPLTLTEGTSYTPGTATVTGTLTRNTEGCPAARLSGSFASTTPRQTYTFLVGNEVIEGVSPNPVEFGRVRAGGLAERSATISATREGLIEEIAVRTGTYFSIVDPNRCRGRQLLLGGSCNFTVVVSAPGETGRELSDTVIVRLAGRSYEAALRART